MCPVPCLCGLPRLHLLTVSSLRLLGDKTPVESRTTLKIMMISTSLSYLLCTRALIGSDASTTKLTSPNKTGNEMERVIGIGEAARTVSLLVQIGPSQSSPPEPVESRVTCIRHLPPSFTPTLFTSNVESRNPNTIAIKIPCCYGRRTCSHKH